MDTIRADREVGDRGIVALHESGLHVSSARLTPDSVALAEFNETADVS